MSDERTRQVREPTASFGATEAQNNFGRLLKLAGRGEAVYITRYGHAEAVLISAERYRELSGEVAPGLERLTREFDARVARMQTDEAAAGFDALFEADAEQLEEAAVKGARAGDD